MHPDYINSLYNLSVLVIHALSNKFITIAKQIIRWAKKMMYKDRSDEINEARTTDIKYLISTKTGTWSSHGRVAKDAIVQACVYTTTSKIESQRVSYTIGMKDDHSLHNMPQTFIINHYDEDRQK